MEILGKVHVLFEQTGTFRDVWRSLGYAATCYDISDKAGKTDVVCDLFDEIERAYTSCYSVFDTFCPDDFLMAFFPCTYFSTLSLMDFNLSRHGTETKPVTKRLEYAIEKVGKRAAYHVLLYKLVHVVVSRGLRMVLENPAQEPNFLLTGKNFPRPTFIDYNRLRHGDVYKKPTAYWFFNCEQGTPLRDFGSKYVMQKIMDVHKTKDASRELRRSMIAPEYAENFVRHAVLGEPCEERNPAQLEMF